MHRSVCRFTDCGNIPSGELQEESTTGEVQEVNALSTFLIAKESFPQHDAAVTCLCKRQDVVSLASVKMLDKVDLVLAAQTLKHNNNVGEQSR